MKKHKKKWKKIKKQQNNKKTVKYGRLKTVANTNLFEFEEALDKQRKFTGAAKHSDPGHTWTIWEWDEESNKG